MIGQYLQAGPHYEEHEEHVQKVLELQPPREARTDPGWLWIKVSMSGISLRLCASAIMQSSAAVPMGTSHSVLIHFRPIRMCGKIPCCGGIQ
ncbi:hypothetical protein [Pararhizobium sp.]|uniref:hypothetical protein n=1 Tax=Pararhizobium sp. TaxID=1977563 RepID=UPI003D0BC869